jgi:hypothetical protein
MLKVKQLQSRVLGNLVKLSESSGEKKQGLGQLVKSAIPAELDSAGGAFSVTGNEVSL